MTDAVALDSFEVFRIADVLGRTWRILPRTLLPFSLVTLVIGLPSLLITLVHPPSATPHSTADGLGLLVQTLLDPISQGVLYGALVPMLQGQPVRLAGVTRQGLERYLALLGVSILSSLMLILGFAALFVPGFIVATMLIVAAPVCVVERLGSRASLRRSMALTRGHRRKILGILALFALALMIPSVPAIGLAVALGEGFGGELLLSAWTAITSAAFIVLNGVLYHQLRAAAGDLGGQRLAAVFD